MALPPDFVDHQILEHEDLNAILVVGRQLVSDFQSLTAALNAQTGTLSAIQTTMGQQATDIDALQQITDAGGSPLPPTGLALVTATITTLTVSWNVVAGANITYLVEYQESPDGTSFTAVPTTAALQTTITGLVAETDYFVRVSTVAGTFTGPAGTPVIFTTAAAPAVPIAPVAVPLGTPTTTSVTLDWNPVANATQYEAGYQTAGVWASSITTPSTTTQATFTGLTPGTSYTFQVRADNGATLGSLSAPVVATTSAAGPTPPAQVTGGVASGATASTINYAWTAFAAIGTPPTIPGVRAPALTIAPGSVAYTFSNLAFDSTTTTPAFGNQTINLSCTKGQLSFTPIGTTTVRAGAQNSTFVSLLGVWADLMASADTITYRSPAALVNDTDSIAIELWVAGSTAPQTGTIPVTISVGAVTSETGGYNPTGGVTYVPSISGDTGATWTASPKQTANTITYGGLIASHLYQFRVHAVSLANVSGIDSTVTSFSTLAAATPGVIGDPTGTTAVRATDFVGTFGVNAYPRNGQDGIAPSQIGPCFTYLSGGTGHRLLLRTYTWSGSSNGALFTSDFNALIASNQIKAAPCIDHFNGVADGSGVAYVAANLNPSDVAYVEGVNEPNIANFGLLTPAYTLTQQQLIYNAAHPRGIKVALPSVLFRSSDQITWWGSDLAAALAASDWSTLHHYPNNGCYSGNNELINWTDPTSQHSTFAFTEHNAVEYNPPGSTTSYYQVNAGTVSGWHILCGWVIAYFHRNVRSFIYFTMGDYPGQTLNFGLFSGSSTAPHSWTKQIANFIHLLADNGATRFTFTPGKINVTVTGLPAGSWANSGGSMHWLQTSDGDFWGILQNEQNQLSATTTSVHLAFGTNCTRIEDYPVTGPAGTVLTIQAPRTTLNNVNAIDIVLGTEVRLIRVVKI